MDTTHTALQYLLALFLGVQGLATPDPSGDHRQSIGLRHRKPGRYIGPGEDTRNMFVTWTTIRFMDRPQDHVLHGLNASCLAGRHTSLQGCMSRCATWPLNTHECFVAPFVVRFSVDFTYHPTLRQTNILHQSVVSPTGETGLLTHKVRGDIIGPYVYYTS